MATFYHETKAINPPSQVRILLYLLLVPSIVFILLPQLTGLPSHLAILPYVTFFLILIAIYLRNLEHTRNLSRVLLFASITVIAVSSAIAPPPMGLFFLFWWLMLPIVGMISLYYPYGMYLGLFLAFASVIITSPLPLIIIFVVPLLWLFTLYFISETHLLKLLRQQNEANAMKDEFISFASHQLRTPLSAMKWFGEMLLAGDAGKLTKEQKNFIQKIFVSNQRMIEFVDTLLNISRIESGRLTNSPQPIDLKQLVSETIAEVKPKASEKQQRLSSSLPATIPTVNFDPALVHEVISNLLTNAIKYTPNKGRISLKVSQDSDNLTVEVSDSGYGIPKTQTRQIFQKFFRANNISRLETEGTGLGLYLAWLIVNSWDGKIWFSSVEGQGTTFWFTLPRSGSRPHQGQITLTPLRH